MDQFFPSFSSPACDSVIQLGSFVYFLFVFFNINFLITLWLFPMLINLIVVFEYMQHCVFEYITTLTLYSEMLLLHPFLPFFLMPHLSLCRQTISLISDLFFLCFLLQKYIGKCMVSYFSLFLIQRQHPVCTLLYSALFT